MLDIMKNGENAMRAFETALRIQTANMGNMSTVGYKSLKYSFKTIFNKVLNTGSAGTIDTGGTNPNQEGSTVGLANIWVDFSQGEIGSGGKLDLALQGNGMFMVSPDNGRTFLYTRSGNFKFSQDGFLLDNSGRQVYGFKYLGNGQYDTTNISPIKANDSATAGWQYQGRSGILVNDYDASQKNVGDLENAKPLYKVALTDFPNSAALIQHDGTTYRATPAAGIPFSPAVSGENGMAEAISQAVEKSNVFFIGETVDAMEVQRAMSASLTAVKIASQQIQNIIQQLGS
ncbi:MAG: flagellar hook-basal body complex protein [Candidatus Margulisbacteria bacterium]|nr:flagellar hook-basal body complex protein [Candidatus Margulisiibacteriota bacterium]